MILTFIGFLIAFYYFIKIVKRKLCRPSFTDKTVWITGGSSGLGQNLAYQISKRGVGRLIISARNVDQLQRVKNSCKDPSKVTIIKMDMTDFQSVRKITDQTLRDLQAQDLKLDIMIENAGVSMRSDFINFSFENHLSVIDVNINGVFNHLQAILPHMMRTKNGQIVSISSTLSKYDFANRTSYVASKFGLNGLIDSLRTEVSEYNIAVTNILPGYIQTNVALNAFVSNKGQKYNQKDKFIHLGMKPQKFAEEAVRAIYMRENQVQVSKEWIMNPLRILIRGVFPDLSFLWSRYANKAAIKANLEAYYSKK